MGRSNGLGQCFFFSLQNFTIFWQRNWEIFGKLAYCVHHKFLYTRIYCYKARWSHCYNIMNNFTTKSNPIDLFVKSYYFWRLVLSLHLFFWVSSWGLSYLQNHLEDIKTQDRKHERKSTMLEMFDIVWTLYPRYFTNNSTIVQK
jgi:hypothetical protein